MTCRRCGLPEQKGNTEVELTAIERKSKQEISVYLCEFCWNEINDFIFKRKEIEE